MGYWSTRGLRGSVLEDIINFTNNFYRNKGLAVIQKIPTPITPVEVDNKAHTIKLAYFDSQSTVDYIGMAQGVGICFDAKETSQKSLPIQNIHEHQINFMEDFNRHGGVAFLLVHFSIVGKHYFLPMEVLRQYWNEAQQGGRKSIPLKAFEERFEIQLKNGGILNYLEAVNTYLTDKR
ncbi:MAG: Holliday junction resolvase RecU [Firmicutes bacterium]|nr:Holliday junction resolvase RecU [Bacillota bacterium]